MPSPTPAPEAKVSPATIIFLSVKRLNFRLYGTLCLFRLFPTLYSTFRVHILGSMPDANSLSIASQMAWVSVILKVCPWLLNYKSQG